MSKVFISYRRDDSNDVVGRIYDHLALKFGAEKIFKDVDSIPLGEDFREIIEKSVQSCDVILVVIGTKWLESENGLGQRRIDSPDDFVRIEIEAGLKRKISVVPVLVAGASMPKYEQLPLALKDLAFQNGLNVRSDPDFKNDLYRLNKYLMEVISPKNNSILIKLISVRNTGISFLLIALAIIVGFFYENSLEENTEVLPQRKTTTESINNNFQSVLEKYTVQIFYLSTEKDLAPNKNARIIASILRDTRLKTLLVTPKASSFWGVRPKANGETQG